MRFLLSRRWLFFAVAVALAAWGAVLLGQWQFHRLDARKAENSLVTHNLDAPAVPIDQVMSTDRAPSPHDEWQRVTVTGVYDDEATVILKYQTRDGGAGVDVVTPLVTASGAAVLVDRGWLATPNAGNHRPETPAPPPGTVEVTGFVRANATGGATAVDDLATRAISSESLAKVVSHPLYVGFLDLSAQSPKAGTELATIELPDHTSQGPHFFYGLQWWFFGALAVFGFFYLMYDEWRRAKSGSGPRRRPGSKGPGSKSPKHPAVDREHHPADE